MVFEFERTQLDVILQLKILTLTLYWCTHVTNVDS